MQLQRLIYVLVSCTQVAYRSLNLFLALLAFGSAQDLSVFLSWKFLVKLVIGGSIATGFVL